MVADLYFHGIDAHSGVAAYNPLPILEEGSQSNSSPTPQSHLDDSRSHIYVYENQWSTQADEHEAHCRKKPGRSIGVASHKRIRAKELDNQQPDGAGNLIDGLRRYSFLPLLDHTSEYIRRDGPSIQFPTDVAEEGDKRRKSSSQELLRQILWQSRRGSSNSRLGSLVPNMSRSQESKQLGQLREVSCSEDATPHVCIDEQRND